MSCLKGGNFHLCLKFLEASMTDKALRLCCLDLLLDDRFRRSLRPWRVLTFETIPFDVK